MEPVRDRHCAIVDYNGDFFELASCAHHRMEIPDPHGAWELLLPDSGNDVLGNMLVKVLNQSRFVSAEEVMTLRAGAMDLRQARNKRLLELYGYKTERELLKRLVTCAVERKAGVLLFAPCRQKKYRYWEGRAEDELTIPAASTPAEIGQSLRIALGRVL